MWQHSLRLSIISKSPNLHTVSLYLPGCSWLQSNWENIFFLDPLALQKRLIQGPFYNHENLSWACHCSQSQVQPFSTLPYLLLENGRRCGPHAGKNLCCCTSQTHLRKKNLFLCLLFCLFFVFSIFVFWPTETTTTTANLQSLTYLIHLKSTNQVTLSNEHKNHLFLAYFDLVYYDMNPSQVFIFSCISSWPKEGHTHLVDDWRRHLSFFCHV